MTQKTEYIAYLDDANRVRRRVRFTWEGRFVSSFMVQLEVFRNNSWHTVVRYDGAHGFAHRDAYLLSGEQRKEALGLNYSDALTYAIGDIKARWSVYIERFLRGEWP